MSTKTREATGNSASPNNWTASAGNKWDCVADADDGTYIYLLGAASGGQRFTFTAFDVPAGSTAITVTVRTRAQRTAAGAVSMMANLRVGGVSHNATATALGTTWADKDFVWSTNPESGVDWTVDDVNGTGSYPITEFGPYPSGLGAGEEIDCSRCYLEVTYSEAGGGTPINENFGEELMWE